MSRYGYGRVSSKGQQRYGTSLEEQRNRLISEGVPDENLFLEAYTGTKVHRPLFEKLLSMLQPGDELVVCKLDRFARTAPEGAMLVRDLVSRGIRVNILNMGIADNSPMGKVMVSVMLAFAEFERDMILERTASGKAHRRETDPTWRDGRKAISLDEERLCQLQALQAAGQVSVSECCRELGISKGTWYNRMR